MSGVMWVNSMLRRILAKILPVMERREIPLYSSHSLFDQLSCRWFVCLSYWTFPRYIIARNKNANDD